MDANPLENTIREMAARGVEAIQGRQAESIRRMEAELVAEIEAFRTQTANATQARVEQALARLENRANLERKKHKLSQLESFVGTMVEEATRSVRTSPQYLPFLVDAVGEAVRKVTGGAIVGLATEDLGLVPQIKAAIKETGSDREIRFEEDATIGLGGCLLRDAKSGRIFNATLERILYRKQAQIRREVVQIIAQAQTKDTPKVASPRPAAWSAGLSLGAKS
jgi:vacuolar-type H+-ATPase subunit E/Vma4